MSSDVAARETTAYNLRVGDEFCYATDAARYVFHVAEIDHGGLGIEVNDRIHRTRFRVLTRTGGTRHTVPKGRAVCITNAKPRRAP